MAPKEALSIFLQQDLLTVLSYHDEQGKIIRGAVELDLFEDRLYRNIAATVYNYIDRYRKVPKDHLQDLFEDTLLDRSDRKAKERGGELRRILNEIHNNSGEVNVKYTMDRLDQFIRFQEIAKASIEIAEIVVEGKVTNVERADEILNQVSKKKLTLFDPGTFFGDTKRSLSFLEEQEQDIFPTGIEVLDQEDLGPKRGELHLFVGLPKRGKTWYLINLGKAAFRHGHKVLHISLEMSEKQILRRYHQMTFAVARRRPREGQEFTRTKLRIATDTGELKAIRPRPFIPRHTFDDPGIYKYLLDKHRRFSRKMNNVIVKAFPTGQLTIKMLETYLDNVENQYHFTPDLLLVDYPQLMDLDTKNLRQELGKVVKQLRGMAVERNIAVAAVSQSNRGGLSVGGTLPVITMEHVAEDFSQTQTADVVLTYNQTPGEKVLNLARIYVAAARDQECYFSILITQQYALGQFCGGRYRLERGSYRMTNKSETTLIKLLQSDDDDGDEGND